MSAELEKRVEAIERFLEEEFDGRIISVAHKLRDSDNFIIPFWQKGTEHATGHFLNRLGRWLLWIISGTLAGWLLIIAASRGAFKAFLP